MLLENIFFCSFELASVSIVDCSKIYDVFYNSPQVVARWHVLSYDLWMFVKILGLIGLEPGGVSAMYEEGRLL